jgi:hypothetical protein
MTDTRFDRAPGVLLGLAALAIAQMGCVSACKFDPLSRGIGVQN